MSLTLRTSSAMGVARFWWILPHGARGLLFSLKHGPQLRYLPDDSCRVSPACRGRWVMVLVANLQGVQAVRLYQFKPFSARRIDSCPNERSLQWTRRPGAVQGWK